MKGQMMLITAVLVSLIMLTTGAAVADLGDREYEYIQEGYLSEIIKQETREVDKTFRKNRENYQKMIGFMEDYDSSTTYDDVQQCYNLTLQSSDSVIRLECVG